MSRDVHVPIVPEGDDAVRAPIIPAEEDPSGELCDHTHYVDRANWLRAAILGANDGLVTVGALLTGIGASDSSQKQLLLSACAALVSGAMSMAAGEYISVQQQADTERADVEKERQAQMAGPAMREAELRELIGIWKKRGLSDELAERVAHELTQHDAVRAHARDELGIDIDDHPSALQAAAASAASFAAGAAGPTLAVLLPSDDLRFWAVVAIVTLLLVVFGATGAVLGGSPVLRGSLRVLIGGWLAMLSTYAVGRLFGTDAA